MHINQQGNPTKGRLFSRAGDMSPICFVSIRLFISIIPHL